MAGQPDSGIWVFLECRDGQPVGSAVDLAAEAVRLAGLLGAGVTGVAIGPGDTLDRVASVGVDRLLRIDTPVWDGVDGATPAVALADACSRHRPSLVLISGTALGRDAAPRLAARLGAPIVGDCTYLRVAGDGALEATRSERDGSGATRLRFDGPGPAVVMVPPGILPATPADQECEVEVLVEPGPDLRSPANVIESAPIDPADLALEDAPVLVSGGLGMGGPGGFELLGDLAGVIGGKVAASRRATDEGWAETGMLVGQTGKTVAPDLYLALGISGASQHVLGMQDAGFVVSVNTDPHAPIHSIADLAVVADAREFVPRLAAAFRKALDSGGGP